MLWHEFQIHNSLYNLTLQQACNMTEYRGRNAIEYAYSLRLFDYQKRHIPQIR